MRENSDECVKINFALNLTLSNLNLNLLGGNKSKPLVASKFDKMTFLFHKVSFQLDVNNIFQKCEFKLKKLLVYNDCSSWPTNLTENPLEKLILNTESQLLNRELYNSDLPTITNSNFLEITFTRALVSNLTKRLGGANQNEPKSTKLENYKINKKKAENLFKNMQKWIIELNCTINDLDLIFHLKKIQLLLEFANDVNVLIKNYYIQSRPLPNRSELWSEPFNLIPLIKASDMPLINIEINRVRLIFPCMNCKDNLDIVMAQVFNLNLTSQIENPLSRNFLHNSASSSIYNKAKSNGHLYMPGFPFEDRQYSLQLSNFALLAANSTHLSNKQQPNRFVPILNSVNLKAIVGLPILLGHKLINGYIVEIGITNQQTHVYLNNLFLNLMHNLVEENLVFLDRARVEWNVKADSFCSKLTIHKIIKNFEANYTNKPLPQTPSNKTRKSNRKVSDAPQCMQLIPFDFLLTAENIHVCFYLLNKPDSRLSRLCWAHFIQPHVCVVIHEKLQKFEVSIFDFDLKRSSSSSAAINQYDMPVKSEFLIPLIETKLGEQDSKTGILPGFFSLKIKNFSSLFCQPTKELYSINESDEQLNRSCVKGLVCFCSCCLRCYEFRVDQNIKVEEEALKTKVLIERPMRLKANLVFLTQLNEFLDSLDALACQKPAPTDSCQSGGFDVIQNVLFDLNIHLVTSQLVFVFEITDTDQSSIQFHSSLTGVSVFLSKTDDVHSNIDETVNSSLLLKYFQGNKVEVNRNTINRLVCSLNDFQCKFQSMRASQPFMGPVTIKVEMTQNLNYADANFFVNIGSFSIIMNQNLMRLIARMEGLLRKYFTNENVSFIFRFSLIIRKAKNFNFES